MFIGLSLALTAPVSATPVDGGGGGEGNRVVLDGEPIIIDGDPVIFTPPE